MFIYIDFNYVVCFKKIDRLQNWENIGVVCWLKKVVISQIKEVFVNVGMHTNSKLQFEDIYTNWI